MNTTYSLIDEELKRTGGNLSKVARGLGLNYFALKERQLLAQLNRKTGVHPAKGPEPEDITTLGCPGWELNVIAVKRQGEAWPKKYAAVIEDARRKFDEGTHEMYQTSDKGWVVQYLIPRLRPVARRTFFASMERWV